MIHVLPGAEKIKLKNLQAGDRIVLLFDREDGYWHERLLLAKISDRRWVVCTPHGDVYDEDLGEALDVREVGPRGGVPDTLRQVNKKGLYLHLPDKILRNQEQLCTEAEVLAAKVILDEKPKKDRSKVALLPLGTGRGARASVGGKSKDAEVIWLALESRGGYTVGDPVAAELLEDDGKPGMHNDDRGLVDLPSGEVLAVGADGTLVGTDTPRGGVPIPEAESDLRTLPVNYLFDGSRKRTFNGAAALLSTTDFVGWPIKGPRTAKWLADQFAQGSQSPTQRHFWWRSVQQLGASDVGVDDHYFLSELFELACTVDQLNVGELVVFEVIARRFQLWEEVYAASLREAEAGSEAAPWLDERQIFLGHERSRGHALVCPAFEVWVADRLKDESSILKERRKGREERLLYQGVDPEKAAAVAAGGAGATEHKPKPRGGRGGGRR